MKKLYFYLSMLTILLLTSCRQDDEIGAGIDLQPGEYLFSVTLPEPVEALSRSMGDVVDLTDKEMHVLLFDKNGFFVANQTASSVKQENGIYTYKVELPISDEPRALHFILGKVEYPTFVPDDSEASVFSSLSVSGGEDAYWQRIKVDEIKDGMKPLGNINLIRNFAKISVDNQSTNGNFIFEGFAVVRSTDAGTVAPYVGPDMAENGGFAQFNLGDDYATFVSKNHNFGGNTAGTVIEEVPQSFTNAPQYVYERNQDKAQRPTYVLIKARFQDKECYYKLDIVSTDQQTWITKYLNLYRNFHYQIHITDVKGAGYATPEEAMQAAASNNIGASVEVSQVNTIQDGLGNELWVSTLDTLLVTSQGAEIYYRYTTGMNASGEGGTVSNGQVVVTPVSEGNGGINPKAISSWEAKDGVLRVTPAALPELMETQEFVIATPSGLSRRVAISVRQPFVFSAVDCDQLVESQIGAGLTCIVRLPDNMPTAVFPLTLHIEPTRKSIYPDAEMNRIPVETGDHTFSYQAEVTYNDYRRNQTFFFHFKTNMKESATTIKVTNEYFEDRNNTASFTNTDQPVLGFGKVTLNGYEALYHCSDYYNQGEELTLAFSLPCNKPDHTTETHPVEIFADYLDLNHAVSETGTFTVRADGQCIFYTPKPEYLNKEQKITFTITKDFASETIQLSSLDHRTATIDYTTPSLSLLVKHRYKTGWLYPTWHEDPVPNRTEIKIFKDTNYTQLVETKQADGNGRITLDTFVGFSETDDLYFEAKVTSGDGRGTYRGNMEVQDLITNKQILLEEEN